MSISSKLWGVIDLLRPDHYLKNTFVFLPLFFARELLNWQKVEHVLPVFAAFCLIASGVYVLNDLCDQAQDKLHPVKKMRPLPSGVVKPSEAFVLLFCLVLTAALVVIYTLPRTAAMLIAIYVVFNLGYSLGLKHKAVIDVTIIALGFVLRIVAGGVAAGVKCSHWLIMIGFLLALFVAMAKRKDDLRLGPDAKATRPCLEGYNFELLNVGMGMLSSVTLVAYVLYTLSPDVIAKYQSSKLYLTSFWVILGFLRYFQLELVENRGGDPIKILYKDLPLQMSVIGWALTFQLVTYWNF